MCRPAFSHCATSGFIGRAEAELAVMIQDAADVEAVKLKTKGLYVTSLFV